jgi:Na+/proline symporter
MRTNRKRVQLPFLFRAADGLGADGKVIARAYGNVIEGVFTRADKARELIPTDTPNLVAGIVREYGVFGNWLWWAFLLSGSVTTFFVARLWRRSGVRTDVEFYELRYSGAPAAWLRGFRAAYLGVLFNVLIMANVTLAAIKIGGVLLGLSPLVTVATAAGITLAYSMVGGLTGVLLTDLVQFAVAMVGSAAAAAYLVGLPEVGGLAALVARPEVATEEQR